MKSITTLIPDIYDVVQKKEGPFTPEAIRCLGEEVSHRIASQFETDAGGQSKRGLRLSRLGPACPRALWYSIHHPEMAEQLPPWATIKYTYGHILEAMVIALAKAAGHTVEGEQDELNVDGITGHRDCVIDGCIVDVKSSSSRGFAKFKDGSIAQDDSFGYLDQLDAYLVGSLEDPLVTTKDKGYLLAIDKTLGHMALYSHDIRETRIRNRIAEYKRTASLPFAPDCTCGTRPEGKSGNISLDTKASYNVFKHCCFPHLRTFLYANGPVYLTQVVRKPDVPEINREGKIIYAS